MTGQLASLGAERATGNSVKKNKEITNRQNKSADTSYDVDLSSKSRSLRSQQKKAYDIAKSTPSVREQKVAELKEKIKNGTYQMDSGKIADGILKEAIRDHLAAIE